MYVSSQFDESAFGALYVNRSSRWNWGATLEQTPELRLRTTGIEADSDRISAVTRSAIDSCGRTGRSADSSPIPSIDHGVSSSAPGCGRSAFERERRTEVISLESGKVVEHDRQPFPSEPSVGMAEAGVALIGDTAIFGATGPMLGTRYRLQTTTAVGGLKYTSVLADYRRYLMPVRPFTLAVRIVHTGRYGPDAADFRMRDSYVGSSSLVRGYGASDGRPVRVPALEARIVLS